MIGNRNLKTSRRKELKPVNESKCIFIFNDCCNVYVIKSGENAILIDFSSGEILGYLHKIGIKKVNSVYFTHAHRDQCMGVTRAIEQNIPLHFPEKARDFVDPEMRPDLNGSTLLIRSYPGKFEPPRPFKKGIFDIKEGNRSDWDDFDVEIVSIPGHIDHQLAYIIDMEDQRYTFCGDAIHSPGKIHEAYNLETDHYTGKGAREAAESLRKLKQLRPDVLCPSHGAPMTGDIWAKLELTQYKLIFFSELKDTVSRRRPASKRVIRPQNDVLMQISKHLWIWNNSYFLLSDSKVVLMVDNAGLLPDAFWEQYKRKIGNYPIEVIFVTHIHCDHVEGVEPLRKKQLLQVWVPEFMADAIENPHKFRRPWLPKYGTKVNTRLKENKLFQWHEYTFECYVFPGQTDYHTAYETEIDGHHVLFSGDNFYPNQQWGGTGGLSGFNGGHPIKGWRRSAELVLKIEPEWILASHTQPFYYRREDFEAVLLWSDQCAQAMRDIAPDECLERHHDPHLITLNPYFQHLSDELSIEACVKNPYEHTIIVQLKLILPEKMNTTNDYRYLKIFPGTINKTNWLISVDRDKLLTGIKMITVDVVYDKVYLGEKAECYIKC